MTDRARSEAIFIVDISYPTAEVALQIDERIQHIVISDKDIVAPPGHGKLWIPRVTRATALLENLRALHSLRSRWKVVRCVVIGVPGVRTDEVALALLYAAVISRNVLCFDGISQRSIYATPWHTLRAILRGLAQAILRPVKVRTRALRQTARKRSTVDKQSQEESLFGVYTKQDTFSLPLDPVIVETNGGSLYGSFSQGWYLPDLSRRSQRYSVRTNRHRLYEVSLHVERIERMEEESALFNKRQILEYPYFLGRRGQSHTYVVSTRRDVREIERGINLLWHTTGYYHWLIEGVPRILDLMDDGVDFDRYPLIMPPLAPYHREILAVFGIAPERQVISLDKGDWCHINDCIFPTTNFPFADREIEDPSGQPDRALLVRLRDRILDRIGIECAAAGKGSRRLFISRAKASWRNFDAETEAELVSLLESFGYERICLEDYAWIKQVKMMTEAESIAGLHGAGLANILFARSSSLLEFQNPLQVRAYFAVMARELELKYCYLVGKQTRNSPLFDDICIDMTSTRRALNWIHQ